MLLDKNSKIVVFGGLGFIGENLVNYLDSKGYSDITIIDRGIEPESERYDLYKDILSKFKGINFDSEKQELTEIENYLKEADAIFNLTFPKDFNFSLDKKILKYCSKNNSKCLHIFFGSSMQYDISNEVFSENSSLEGPNDYGKAKNELEVIYRKYYEKKNLPIVFLRIANPYGYSHNFYKKRTMDAYLFNGIKAKELNISMSKNVYKDMIYIDDFLDAFNALLECPNSVGETFNIGSGVKTTVGDFLDIISKNFPEVKINYNPQEGARPYVFDISKLEKYTGWKPKISFEEGFNMLKEKLKL